MTDLICRGLKTVLAAGSAQGVSSLWFEGTYLFILKKDFVTFLQVIGITLISGILAISANLAKFLF